KVLKITRDEGNLMRIPWGRLVRAENNIGQRSLNLRSKVYRLGSLVAGFGRPFSPLPIAHQGKHYPTILEIAMQGFLWRSPRDVPYATIRTATPHHKSRESRATGEGTD